MRYIKKPVTKRNDPTIPWKQENFTNIFRDDPASDIPPGGLADSINGLLFGKRVFVRPGDKILNDTYGLPLDTTQLFTSGVAKSGYTVTHSSAEFTSSDVGKFIIWADENVDMIVSVIDGGEVLVDTNTVQAQTSFNMRSQVWANHWHEKSKKIFLHIGIELYYTDWNVANGWTKLPLPSATFLQQSRSEFSHEEELVYIANPLGLYVIDTTDSDDIFVMKMNHASPPNTITPTTDELTGSNLPVTYPPADEESEHNRFGRNYLFSMMRLEGNADNNRGDARLVKESSTNTALESNDYVDYKESWRIHGFYNADLAGTSRTYTILEIDIRESSGHYLQYFKSLGESALALTIEGVQRDVVTNFLEDEIQTYEDIANSFRTAIRAVFPEYKYIQVNYSTTGYLVVVSGQPGINVQSVADPTDSIYYSNRLNRIPYFNTVTTETIPSHNLIGTKDEAALQRPAGQYGYSHYSLYSTRSLGPDYRIDKNNIPNPEYFIWQKDVPLIKPMTAITGLYNSVAAIYALEERISDEDVGSWIIHPDGTRNQLSVKQNTINGLLYNEGNAIESNIKSSGTATAILTNNLFDNLGTFITDGALINDLVVNYSANPPEMARITDIISEQQVTLDSDIFSVGTESYHIGGGAVAIGTDEVMLATKLETNVNRTDGSYSFSSDDVGKLMFWADGTIDTIIAFVDADNLTVNNSGTIAKPIAMSFEPTGRNYNDALPDTILEHRATDFPVLNRFYDPFPSSDMIAIVPGFISVALEDETKGYYSQYSNKYRYLAGHYYAEYQNFIMTDLIKGIDRMPNQLIVWCKNSTHKFQTNVIDNVTDPRVAESIAILSGQSVVDENIGISDRIGVHSYGAGFKNVVTSEPGVRTFDGYRYGENKLLDNTGRGHVKKDFQILKNRIICYYEPNLYGMMFWGTTSTHVDADGLPLLSRSDKCYRMAVEAQQGSGWAELGLGDWNYLELNNKPLLVTDNDGNKLTMLFDSKFGKAHRLSTRKLPATGSSDEVEFTFTDGETAAGIDGTEIPWNILVREHMAMEEQWKLRYQEEYWFLRPYLESRKNALGYNEYGFRENQSLTIKMYTDGNALEVSEAHTFDPKATIYQPYTVEERRIQTRLSGLTSEIIITGINARYDVLKRRYIEDNQKETGYQEILSDIILRASRGYPKTLNLATAEDQENTSFALTELTGPDGKEGSAFTINSGYASYSGLTGSYRNVLFSFKASVITGTGNIYDEYISAISSRIKISRNALDGLDVHHNGILKGNVTITADAWITVMITLSSNDNEFIIRSAGSDLVVTKVVASWSGDIDLDDTADVRIGESLVAAEELFDIIIQDFTGGEITDDMFDYYVRDVYKYEGFSLLPIVENEEVEDIGIIQETGSAPDIIQESGAQPDVIQEVGD